MGVITFAVLATLVVLAALAVVLHPDPVYSALSLVIVLCLLAVFFIALDAHLVAALQVLVYAGAIMVLFLFVVMLLGRSLETSRPWAARPGLWIGGGIGAVGLAAAVVSLIARAPLPPMQPVSEGYGTTEALAIELFTTYLLPFELTSLLLLIAVIGAVVLAKGRP